MRIMQKVLFVVPTALSLLPVACSKARTGSGQNSVSVTASENPVNPQVTVVRAMKALTPSNLVIDVDLLSGTRPDVDAVIKAMEDIKRHGETAGDWIEASLSRPGIGNVIFEVDRVNNRLNPEKDFGPFKGPVRGKYEKTALDRRTVNWYSFGRIDIGVEPDDSSYYVIRVRMQQ